MRPFFGRIYCSLFPHHAAAALHEEVTKGHVKRVKARLTARPDLVFSKDKYGRTPLHFTARSDVTELLLASGAHVNAKDNDGRTPLHVAHSTLAAKVLLANGADVNAKNKYGMTPSDSCCTELTANNSEKLLPLLALLAGGMDKAQLLVMVRSPEHRGAVSSQDRYLEDLLRKDLIREKEAAKSIGSRGETVLKFATPQEIARYKAEKAFVAKLMQAVNASLGDKNSPDQIIRPVLGSRDAFYIIPEVLGDIRANYEAALNSVGIDLNLFTQPEMSELWAEAAWLLDSLHNDKFEVRWELNGDMSVIPKDAGGNLLVGQVYGEARMRVMLGWSEATGIPVRLELLVGYLTSDT